jgi:glycosyltransferase involved in cell wall biosynthesis
VRVALDLTPLLGPVTGVGVFAGAVAAELGARPAIDVVGYATSWRGRERLASVVPARVTVGRRPMAARPLRALWARGERPPIEWWTGPVDVVHGTNFVVPPVRRRRGAARLVTVHDLTPVRFPELCNADTLAYPALVRRAVRAGAWVHTPSCFVADEVRAWLGPGAAERVVAVHNGVNPSGDGDPAAGRRLARSAERYIVALATIEPRKDLVTLVRAFDALAGDLTDVDLVVAGPDGWGVEAFQATVAAARHGARVHRLGWLDGGQRADLLAGAAVLAYPSVYEGFGLPPLEAMSAGVPVVCSDAGPLPEVTGDAALRVPVGDVDGLAGALRTVLVDGGVRDRLVAAGRARVGRFSWAACADGLIDLYHRATAIC